MSLQIPLPALPVQREIVRILDSFTLYSAELTAELIARRKQYEFYRDKLLNFNTSIEETTIGDIALVTKLAGFEFTNYVKYSDFGNVIALRGLNVKNGKLDLTDIKYIDGSDFSKLNRSKLQIGDMLFTYVGTIGQVALIEEDDKYYLAPNVALIRLKRKDIMPKYIRYYFQSNAFFSTQILRLLQSSSMQNIPMEKIRKFVVKIPPMDVQERIVKVLDNFDAICSDLGIGLPAEIEKRQKQYEYYREKLLTFDGKYATILTERNGTERNGTERAGLIRLLQYVYGFAFVRLGDICSISSGRNTERLNDGEYPVYGSTGIIAKTNIYKFDCEQILIARVGANAGYVYKAYGKYDVSDNTLILSVNSQYNANFIFYNLINMRLNRFAKGGGQPLITAGQIKELLIPLPTIEKQKEIVEILDKFDSLCNDLSAGLPAEIEYRQKQYEYYRDKLLTF